MTRCCPLNGDDIVRKVDGPFSPPALQNLIMNITVIHERLKKQLIFIVFISLGRSNANNRMRNERLRAVRYVLTRTE